MAIVYQQLTQDEMDDAIAENLYGREVEHFHYELNRRNYVEMLKTLPVGDDRGTPEEQEQAAYRAYIEGLVKTETAARDKTEHTYEALEKNFADPTRKAAAIDRAVTKRAAVKAAEAASIEAAAIVKGG